MKDKTIATQVVALGGLGEVGKNMYCIQHEEEIVIVDAGVMFPEDELLGIDYVLPDFTFLKQNQYKIKGLFITHGHEDHIGGVPFLLQSVEIPVIYAPKMAAEIMKKKLEDRNVPYHNIKIFSEDTKIKFKHFEIEFFKTTHSIPDSFGISITTPNGVVVCTGDFKFDLTPIGPMANLHKMARIGEKGVKLLLSDSTNALVEGMSLSESRVDEALGDIFARETGRVIIATFASNVYRLKHIIETCKENNRKVVLFGRSMTNNVEIAMGAGYIKEKDIIITPEEANHLKPEEVCLLCTGTQGEPLAALSRIAAGTHKEIKLMPNDIVIFSSSPIPGNALAISKTINKLYLKGVRVYTNALLGDIHTSGHGYTEELKLMLRLINPEYFMPVHGEYRMLKNHGNLAMDCGMPKNHVFICQNGDIISLSKHGAKKDGSLPAEDIYVDGNRIGDIGSIILRERKTMSTDGILVVICNIDTKNCKLLSHPTVSTRGFVLVNENEELIHAISMKSEEIIHNTLKKKHFSYSDLKSDIIYNITPFIFERTGRKPIILPVVMDIKTEKKQEEKANS